jgi:hypothetical protein
MIPSNEKPLKLNTVSDSKDVAPGPNDSPFTPPPELRTDRERGTGELGTEGTDPSEPIYGTE